MSVLDNVRVEVAFDDDPDTATPAWQDLTSRARLINGIDIERGRSEQYSSPQVGSLRSLVLDNDDGALTPTLVSSPFYPNVKPQNRIRVTYRDPAVPGNLLDAASASFESATVGSWQAGGSVPPALTTSTLHPAAGTRGMLITWGAGGSFPLAQVTVETVIGREYTVRANVWIPAGSPAVVLVIGGSTFGSGSTLTGAMEQISATWTATSRLSIVQVWPLSAPAAGQQCFIDAIRADEAAAPATFTTSPLTGVIVSRYDGHVDAWPTQWPRGGQTESTVTVTAMDVTARLARRRRLGSVLAETYRLNSPTWYFPLDEPSDSTSAGDRVNTGASLSPLQVGSGGAIEFAAATGPPTDGASSPAFAPTDVNNGTYLTGEVPVIYDAPAGITLAAVFNTSVVTPQTIVRITDPSGPYLELGIDSSGRPTATFDNSWLFPNSVTVTSGTVFADGRTHSIAATITYGAGLSKTLKLFVDGVKRGTDQVFDDFIYVGRLSTILTVGGAPGRCFTGSVSHVAAFDQPFLTGGTGVLNDFHNAATTGFSGERSDQRIARILSWVGFPTDRQVLDVGLTKVGHIDPAGKDATALINDVANTEGGIAFADTAGRITFFSRSRRYNVAQVVSFTATADDLDDSGAVFTNSTDDLVNAATVSREGGATARAQDDASIATYGMFEDTASIYAASDLEAFSRAQWMVALGSKPRARLPKLALDALTATPVARQLEIGQRGTVTGLPSQAPASAADVVVEGYRESISAEGWSLEVNATPYLVVRPFLLNDASYGVLDAANCLVY